MKKTLLLLNISFFSLLLSAQQTLGVFQNDSLAFNGYTLFAPSSSRNTYLIDNCGFVINEWTSNYNPGLSVYLLENGHLLRAARIGSAFNAGGTGGRIEEFDWNGNLLWAFDYTSDSFHQHHDIEPLPNGNVLILAWETKSTGEMIAAGRDPATIDGNGLWMEHIIELQPAGAGPAKIVWEWHAFDHLVQDIDNSKNNFGAIADHPELFNINFADDGHVDWLHVNSIAYNPQLDQIILSSRNWNEFWIIDHSTSTEEAAGHDGGKSDKGGDILFRWGNPQTYNRGLPSDRKLYGQHDVHWVADGLPDAGKIMIFNNGAGRPDGDYSSIDVVDPPLDEKGQYILEANSSYGPEDIFWRFTDEPTSKFYSPRVSGARRMPNGNTLICEGTSGNFFEVTSEGKIVWDYVNPVGTNGPASQGDPALNNSVFRVSRYPVYYKAFEGKDLSPGEVLELNPFASDCQLFSSPNTAADDLNWPAELSIFPNPIKDYLTLLNKSGKSLRLRITDVRGRIIATQESTEEELIWDTENWLTGVYIVHLIIVEDQYTLIRKIIKH